MLRRIMVAYEKRQKDVTKDYARRITGKTSDHYARGGENPGWEEGVDRTLYTSGKDFTVDMGKMLGRENSSM